MEEDEEDSDAEEENHVVSSNNPPACRITTGSCYKDKGESKKLLMGMCNGLSNDEEERKVGDLSLEPFVSSRNKKIVHSFCEATLC
jgi:hypothetical protein